MSKTNRTFLLLLCMCLFAFKGMSAQRFVENGMKRAQVYASYHDPFLGVEVTTLDKDTQGRDSLSCPVSIYLSAIIIIVCSWVSWGKLKAYLRPIVITLSLFHFSKKIFRPPKHIYISA